jgi:hypothetical protein
MRADAMPPPSFEKGILAAVTIAREGSAIAIAATPASPPILATHGRRPTGVFDCGYLASMAKELRRLREHTEKI